MKSCVMLWLSDMPPLHLYVYFAEFRDDSESESRGKSRPMKARCPTKCKSYSCMCVCYTPLWAFIEDMSPTLQSSERHGRRGLEAALPEELRLVRIFNMCMICLLEECSMSSLLYF